jgi:hypothetical protein
MTNEAKKALATAAVEAVSACAEFKAAAEKYLAAIGTPEEAEAAEYFVAEAQEDINTIDDTIAFFSSEKAKQFFGEEGAANMLAHMQSVKANGGIYCDCPGCAAAEAVINAKAELLA